MNASSIKAARTRTQNYNQKEDLALCDAWCAISMDATIGTDQAKSMFWERILTTTTPPWTCDQAVHKVLLGIVGAPSMINATDGPVASTK